MAPTTDSPLYRHLDFAMVRAPLLPVEAFLSLQSAGDELALLSDARVRRAVAVGSASLLHALDRFERGALTTKEAARLRDKLLRYLIRMSTRPTPFGLFAGCAIVPVGTHTTVAVSATLGRSHTRPDMAWLMDIVRSAESDLAIRRQLSLVRHPLVRTEGDRISLSERMAGGPGLSGQPVSLRATKIVSLALDLTRQAVPYADLAARLAAASPAATPDKVDRLLTELWEQTILLTDLRPPLTTDSPARYVKSRLEGIPEAATPLQRLDAGLSAAAHWDQLPHDASVSGFLSLLADTGRPEDGSKDSPVQVDMTMSVRGDVGATIAREAARAAELLIRLSPFPRGMSSITGYRHAFLTRYGQDREVPVLDLLDPDRGLGPVASHAHAMVGPSAEVAASRAETLLDLACAALRDRRRVAELDDDVLARLETSHPTATSSPTSLDINCLVAARSHAAIDAGDFTLVVGPNLGAWAAGRNFGRFAHQDAAGRAPAWLTAAADAERVGHFPDDLWAEVVYLPPTFRSANVAIRPAVRTHEVVFGVTPGVEASHVIPLEDLVVGVENERFYVRWTTEDRRVRFASGHMLNHHGAPPVAQFLLDVAHDGRVPFVGFDWGAAEGFPFLPRAQAGRIVLRPAEWRLSKTVVARKDVAAFDRWRANWDVPRHVCLTYGDNRLMLDLDQPDHVRQILNEVGKLSVGGTLVLQEVLPALDDLWLRGDEGHYYAELVVPLVLRPPARAALDAPSTDRPAHHVASSHRLFPPGSEWLMVKLYGPAHREEDVIADALSSFGQNAITAGLADSWFFIRYADPDRHLRLRFHGVADRLSGQLFGQIARWAQGLIDASMCTRFVFDTYDREVERFGGVEGMAASEQIFHADSVAAADLVAVLKTRDWSDNRDRTLLLALSVDDLLGSLGVDESSRLEWYKTQPGADSRDAGGEYRTLKNDLRMAVGDSARWLSGKPYGDVVNATLAARRDRLASCAARLADLAAARALERSIGTLCSSYVHLHLNRVGAAPIERALVGLLFRTRASLAKAPVSAAATAASR